MHFLFFIFHILYSATLIKKSDTYNHLETTKSLDVCRMVISPEFLSFVWSNTLPTQRVLVFRIRIILTIDCAKRDFHSLSIIINEPTCILLFPLVKFSLHSEFFISSCFLLLNLWLKTTEFRSVGSVRPQNVRIIYMNLPVIQFQILSCSPCRCFCLPFKNLVDLFGRAGRNQIYYRVARLDRLKSVLRYRWAL